MVKLEVGKYYRTRDGRKADVQGEWGLNGSDYQYHGEICEGETGLLWKNDGTNYDGPDSPKSLVAEWLDSPVRTVTRLEVVAGTYGPLEVGAVINIPDCERPDDPPPVTVDLSLDDSLTADEIDTLVQHLTAIAEALRES